MLLEQWSNVGGPVFLLLYHSVEYWSNMGGPVSLLMYHAARGVV